ncbi:hypothetical protein [Marinifilum caeruleilacunae]|uniref:Uncharacterized protein n=1 Tax=Marinifilum caeruleilacunae TaxID=2499076 RepID=A0ABX1WZ92_9BACT|nr:hypothetical protein [Marinifilum caeruleilacunae]NOU61389.1 hypothetical protein [Marinifilum caeruleilacunae]
MKKTEKILAIVAVLSVLLNLSTVPFSAVLTTISFTGLSLLYMYLSFALFNNISFRQILKKESYQEVSRIRIFATVLTGMALSVCLIGILFKLLLYPFAEINLITGLNGLSIAIIVSAIMYVIRKDKFYVSILKRIMIVGAVGILFTLTSREQIIDIKYRNHPEHKEALKKAWADPENQELWKKAEEESLKMHNEK